MPRTVDYPWMYPPTYCPLHGFWCDWHPPILDIDDYVIEEEDDTPS